MFSRRLVVVVLFGGVACVSQHSLFFASCRGDLSFLDHVGSLWNLRVRGMWVGMCGSSARGSYIAYVSLLVGLLACLVHGVSSC